MVAIKCITKKNLAKSAALLSKEIRILKVSSVIFYIFRCELNVIQFFIQNVQCVSAFVLLSWLLNNNKGKKKHDESFV